jgi:hypothetical protein
MKLWDIHWGAPAHREVQLVSGTEHSGAGGYSSFCLASLFPCQGCQELDPDEMVLRGKGGKHIDTLPVPHWFITSWHEADTIDGLMDWLVERYGEQYPLLNDMACSMGTCERAEPYAVLAGSE